MTFSSTKPEELRNEIERLNYAINYLRLPLGVDPAIPNSDTVKLLEEFERAFERIKMKNERLHDWEQLFEAAMCRPMTQHKLWPNKWHQDAAGVAFLVTNLEKENTRLNAALKISHENRNLPKP